MLRHWVTACSLRDAHNLKTSDRSEETFCNALEIITITLVTDWQRKNLLTNETHMTLQFHGRNKTRGMRVAHCRTLVAK